MTKIQQRQNCNGPPAWILSYDYETKHYETYTKPLEDFIIGTIALYCTFNIKISCARQTGAAPASAGGSRSAATFTPYSKSKKRRLSSWVSEENGFGDRELESWTFRLFWRLNRDESGIQLNFDDLFFFRESYTKIVLPNSVGETGTPRAWWERNIFSNQ